MGEQLEKLKAERRAERSMDPHAWAEGLERNDAWRTMMVTALFLAVAFLGWRVYEMDKQIKALRPAPVVDCVPVPGPSGEMPPPGFC